jgi:molecular chaperone DnaK (HSP70)
MPSVVGYADDGSVVVGEDADNLPDGQSVASIKRSITDRHKYTRIDMPAGVRDVRIDDLIPHILGAAAQRGSERGVDFGKNATLRIGCPAMWDGYQRRQLLMFAQHAGLPITLTNMIDEPVAAGIAWLAERGTTIATPARVLVFDMGGGTLDVAVLDVHGRDVSVLAAHGVAEAGDALDQAIAEDLDYVLGAAGVDIDALSNPRRLRARLLYAARAAKVALSTETETDVILSRPLFGIGTIRYTRDQLDAVFSSQMDRAELCVADTLRAARLTEQAPGSAYDIARTPIETLVEEVEAVILSGGMSRLPYVAKRLKQLFPPRTIVELASPAPETAVVEGLAKAGRYGRINVYRPSFDVLLEWDGDFRTVYEAFTPLVERWQIARGGTDLRYVRNGLDLALPREGKGRLRVVSHSGDRIRATLGGNSLDGFPVALSEQKFEFSIFPDGRVRLTDGSGTYDGHVGSWHTM